MQKCAAGDVAKVCPVLGELRSRTQMRYRKLSSEEEETNMNSKRGKWNSGVLERRNKGYENDILRRKLVTTVSTTRIGELYGEHCTCLPGRRTIKRESKGFITS